MFTSSEAFLLAVAIVLVLVGLCELVGWLGNTSFLSSVVMGQDNRTSTSKTFVFMWTLLVAWGLFSFLIPGEIIQTHSCAGTSALQAAQAACKSNHDQVGLLQVSWRTFIANGLSGGYLVLLGIPAAAAVSAKVVTQQKNQSGTVVKTAAPSGQPLTTKIAQVFSADDQTTDIGDFQYVVFNVILAAYFVAEFLKITGNGLPTLPDTLLGLTGVSAALYVGKKAAANSQPTVSSVFPSTLRGGQTFTITGTGITPDPTQPPPAGLAPLQVTVNGVLAANVLADPRVADRLTADTPAGLVPAGSGPLAATVEVFTAYGVAAPPYTNALVA